MFLTLTHHAYVTTRLNKNKPAVISTPQAEKKFQLKRINNQKIFDKCINKFNPQDISCDKTDNFLIKYVVN